LRNLNVRHVNQDMRGKWKLGIPTHNLRERVALYICYKVSCTDE